MRPKTPAVERLWPKVDAEGDCWDWIAAIGTGGYGRFWDGENLVQAHRFVWELLVGPIPEGMELDHLCRRRRCVNPDHLHVVTHAENINLGYGAHVHHRRKTHCPWGHPYTSKSGGRRWCQTCITARSTAFKRRKRAQRKAA